MTQDLIPVRSKELVEEARKYCSSITKIEIETTEQYENACEVTKQVQGYSKQLDSERKFVVKPFNDQVKMINGFFKEALVPLDNLRNNLRSSIADYHIKKEKERREAQRKADEAAEKERKRLAKEAEKEAKKADAAAAEGDAAEFKKHHDQSEIKMQLAETVETPVVPQVAPEVDKVHYREKWFAEVTDKREYLSHCLETNDLSAIQIDMTKLNKMARAIKGSYSIPGIKFNCEKTPVIGQ